MTKHIAACAVVLVASVTVSAAMECPPEGEAPGVRLPLYAWPGEGPSVPVGAPQVGTVTLYRLHTGELVVRVRLDEGEPCMTFSVYAKVNGDWHSEDVAQMTTNLERAGETCTSLSLAEYAPDADRITFQVVVKPTKSPAPVGYATEAMLVHLAQMVVVPAEGPHPPPREAPPAPLPPPTPCPYPGPAYPQPCPTYQPPCWTPTPPVYTCPTGGVVVQYGYGYGYGHGPHTCGHYGPQPPDGPQQVVTAREFRLVDQSGNSRATLQTNMYGMPQLMLWDQRQQPRAVLALQSDGSPQFDLVGTDGRAHLTMTILADGSPIVTLLDEGSQPRAMLFLTEDGKPKLELYNAEGKSVFSKP